MNITIIIQDYVSQNVMANVIQVIVHLIILNVLNVGINLKMLYFYREINFNDFIFYNFSNDFIFYNSGKI